MTEVRVAGPTSTTSAASASPSMAPPMVPRPWVPLRFAVAAAVGLVGFGLAVWFAADRAVVAPTHSGVVSAVHVGVLAFLTVAVVGALHQFGPVAGRRPLRSERMVPWSFAALVAGAWLLPSGFAHGPERLVSIGGVVATLGILGVAWNLSGPAAGRGGGLPVFGMRWSFAYLVITAGFGVVYALDRQAGWFPLLSHRVLAHAHLGLLGWLGLTYVSVAEKLWPMFLLAHKPSHRAGAAAVSLLSGGTPVLAVGLLVAWRPLAVAGGLAVGLGLVAHLVSFVGYLRHRRRPLEPLHGFLVASAAFLVTALTFAAVAGFAPVGVGTRTSLVAAEVASLIAWLGLAVIGHAHKIIPFIGYTRLRAEGIRHGPEGQPLQFGDLVVSHPLVTVTLAGATGGFAAIVGGLAVGTAELVAAGGAAVSLAGLIVTANLSLGPRRARRPGVRPQPDSVPLLGRT